MGGKRKKVRKINGKKFTYVGYSFDRKKAEERAEELRKGKYFSRKARIIPATTVGKKKRKGYLIYVTKGVKR